MTEKEVKFYDQKCEECLRNNKIVIKFTNHDDDNSPLITAHDIEGNIFEIKANGEQRFYDNDNDTCRGSVKECQRCKSIKREFNAEQWIVLNRDMSGYEITQRKPQVCGMVETKDTMLNCHNDNAPYQMPIDEGDLNIDFPQNHNEKSTNDDTSVSSTLSLSKNGASVIRRNTKELNSLEMERALIEKPQPWVTQDDSSITPDITGRRRDMIKLYVNPLDALSKSISVDAILKLQNSTLGDVIAAIQRMKAHVTEKSIINVDDTLTSQPTMKRTFEEHFKLTVMKSIEGYVEEKLEHFRASMARAIVEDLLQNAFASLFERRSERSNSEIDKCHLDKASVVVNHDEYANNREACAATTAAAAHPIAIKSFSFV